MGERRCAYRVLWGDLREGDHLEDHNMDGKIILNLIFKKWNGNTDWIDPAQGRDWWRAFVNTVMNLQVPQNAGNFLTI
jgi:hypothetical protein